MKLQLYWFVAICQLVCPSIAAGLTIRIPASHLITNPNTLPPSTHATIIGSFGELRAPLRKDNTITFSNIPSAGSHLLKIYTRDFAFAPYRIDVVGEGADTQISGIFETYPGTRWEDHGIPLIPTGSTVSSYVLLPKVMQRKNFYEERPGFSPLTLLKNPMILLGGVALLFTFGMPKLMENMDPEMKAEFEEMQKQGPTAGLSRAMQGQSPGGTGNFDLAGYLAGSSTPGGGKSSGRDAADNVRERRR